MESGRFDVLIIGAGQAGIPLAHDLAKAGKRVALAEEKDLGGSCVNFGCTPTKAVIASARVAHLARRGNEFGLKIPTVQVNFPAVLERAKRILIESRTSLQKGFDTTDWLNTTRLPEHLVIIGGGYIGLEMSQFYRRMGSRVMVIEGANQVAGPEDQDVSSALQSLLAAEGIEFHLNTSVKCVESIQGNLKLAVEKDKESFTIPASHVFVATGRTPNTEDLGLETIGVKISDRGIVEANDRLATNVEGIWMAGDIRGGRMFTHTSWDDYRILLSQLAGDASRTTSRVVPYAIFTDPELGRVGMTESEARNNHKQIKVARYEMKGNGKARESGETEGFIKLIINAKTNRILGAAVLASEGAEMVHLYVDVMNADAPYTIIRDAIHIHPTLAEAIQSAVKSFE
jgi:pyruvate/2-oxoglutarate dehydrogenase complex dihydrolipoamide dehydrogenase (E3) component